MLTNMQHWDCCICTDMISSCLLAETNVSISSFFVLYWFTLKPVTRYEFSESKYLGRPRKILENNLNILLGEGVNLIELSKKRLAFVNSVISCRFLIPRSIWVNSKYCLSTLTLNIKSATAAHVTRQNEHWADEARWYCRTIEWLVLMKSASQILIDTLQMFNLYL